MKSGLGLQKVLGDTVLTCKLTLWAESLAQWWSACCLPSMCKVLDVTSSTSEQNQTGLPVWHGLYLSLSWHIALPRQRDAMAIHGEAESPAIEYPCYCEPHTLKAKHRFPLNS